MVAKLLAADLYYHAICLQKYIQKYYRSAELSGNSSQSPSGFSKRHYF